MLEMVCPTPCSNPFDATVDFVPISSPLPRHWKIFWQLFFKIFFHRNGQNASLLSTHSSSVDNFSLIVDHKIASTGLSNFLD